jgi:beta-mannosidase
MIELDGAWRAHPGDGDVSKVFAEPAFDDHAWPELDVPGHWRNAPGFAEHDGAVLYRRRFERSRLAWGRRAWLELEGVFYFGDVWLDGDYLGTTEGAFTPHGFEITEQLLGDEHHVLAVEVACPPQRDRTAKRTITGVFGHWDAIDDTWNPGGIWRPVRVRETGPVRIARHRVLCTEATEQRARLRVDLALDAGEFPPDHARVTIDVLDDAGSLLATAARDVAPARGLTDLRLEVDIERPRRWWPAELGEQPLVEVLVAVVIDDRESDGARVRTGLRTVRVDEWIVSVNGERLFVRGANHAPARVDLGAATPEELRRDVHLALGANLNLLRVHAHVTRPEFYLAADQAGLLLWQDLPLQWAYARGARRTAIEQARDIVDSLGHHPSIALWCAHNEPIAVESTQAPITSRRGARLAASMFLPSWNKSVLDRSLSHAIRAADPTRFVDPHSGILPGPASLGTDSHLYFGWYHGDAGDLAPALRAFPRLARFVSEFGAQAVPETAEFCEPAAWPHLAWDRLEQHHCLQRANLERRVPAGEHATFASWRSATQQYQARLLQRHIEDLRRLKYRPAGGYCLFSFADAMPAISWSILDHARVPKLAYDAVRAASRPLLPLVAPGGEVHVVNDRRERLDGAVVTVTAGSARWEFAGDVAADDVTYVGRVDAAVLAASPVTATLEHPSVGRIDHNPVVG